MYGDYLQFHLEYSLHAPVNESGSQQYIHCNNFNPSQQRLKFEITDLHDQQDNPITLMASFVTVLNLGVLGAKCNTSTLVLNMLL